MARRLSYTHSSEPFTAGPAPRVHAGGGEQRRSHMNEYAHYHETYRAKPTDWLAAAALCGLLVFAELLARMVGGVY